jgi:hypothetical protein
MTRALISAGKHRRPGWRLVVAVVTAGLISFGSVGVAYADDCTSNNNSNSNFGCGGGSGSTGGESWPPTSLDWPPNGGSADSGGKGGDSGGGGGGDSDSKPIVLPNSAGSGSGGSSASKPILMPDGQPDPPATTGGAGNSPTASATPTPIVPVGAPPLAH